MADNEARCALVTGGGRGIGAAVARALARSGVRVAITARTRSEIDAVAERIAGDGGEAHALTCDVTDPTAVERMTGEASERLGRIDILVNNAGASSAAPFHRIALDEWQRMFEVNATSAFLCTQALLPGMLERGSGRVVNIASVAGLAGAPYIAAYTAAKHALVGLTRALAAEVADRGVTVNAVCPGYVDTPMTDQSIRRIVERTGRPADQVLQSMLETTRQPRLVTSEEVADAVLALCSPDASATNGAMVVVDAGGLVA